MSQAVSVAVNLNRLPVRWIRTALYAFSFLAISYTHLPTASIHHFLGSAFTFPAVLLLSYFIWEGLDRCPVSWETKALLLVQVAVSLLCAAGGLMSVNLEADLEARAQIRILQSTATGWIPFILLIVFSYAIKKTEFSFDDLLGASIRAAWVLIAYLVFELLGSGLRIPYLAEAFDVTESALHFRLDTDFEAGIRLRGLSNEPSYFAVVVTYLMSILLVGYGRSKPQCGFVLSVLAVLAALSVSKNLLVAMVILFLLQAIYLPRFRLLGGVVLAIALFAAWKWVSEIEGILWQWREGMDTSIITRVGSWIAAWQGFLDAPLLGHGPGMAGVLLPSYYPDFFFLSLEADLWLAHRSELGVPVFSHMFRLLFENGAVGTLVYFTTMVVALRLGAGNRAFQRLVPIIRGAGARIVRAELKRIHQTFLRAA